MMAAMSLPLAFIWNSSGCDPSFEPFDRNELLADCAALAEQQYLELQSASAALSQSAEHYCAETGRELEPIQEEWRRLSVAWQRQQAVRFGPGKDQQLGAAIAWTPADEGRIDALSLDYEWTAASLRTSAASIRGISALEVVLFATLELQITSPYEACSFILANTALVAEAVQPVAESWAPGGEQRVAFTEHNAEPYPNNRTALSELVNASIVAIERASIVQLGAPLGDGIDAAPELVDGRFSARGLANTRALLRGVHDVWAPSEGDARLFDIVDSRGGGVSMRVSREFDTAFAVLDAIEGPLGDAVTNRPEQVEAARAAINVLLRSYQTDVSALLAITVGFSDNDGD
ncbi:MAG: putative lipoprotein [Bradymonadia bacterium]|jgi:predicted lipoprotein